MDGRERFTGAHYLWLVWQWGLTASNLQNTPDAPVYSDTYRAARPSAMACSGYLFVDVSHGTVRAALVMADYLALDRAVWLFLFDKFRSCSGKLLAAGCARDLGEHAGYAGLSLCAPLRCHPTPAGEVVHACLFHWPRLRNRQRGTG